MNMLKLMKQAKDMQEKMQSMQANLEELTVQGQAGGGMIKITLNGKGLVQKVEVDPSLLKEDETDIVEDLFAAAHNDAKHKLDAMIAEKTQGLMSGMGLPEGFKLPF
jgi:DNA-binding YbaB/EbfC family protein